MSRCARAALVVALIALPLAPASAQPVPRNFPPTALRGELVIDNPPEVTLNRLPARLAPGARIRGVQNMLEMSAALVGTRLVVNYTVDTLGELKDVWILTQQESDNRPWPSTPLEAQTWRFDPVAQSWAKP